MNLFLPVRVCLKLGLVSSRGSGLVHLRVETIQLLQGSLRRVGPCCRASGRGRAADERLRRGWLAEVVDARVVGIAVVVFKVGKGGGVGGEVASADLCVTRIVAVRRQRRGQAHMEERLQPDKLSVAGLLLVPSFGLSNPTPTSHPKSVFHLFIPVTGIGDPFQLLFTQSLQFVF